MARAGIRTQVARVALSGLLAGASLAACGSDGDAAGSAGGDGSDGGASGGAVDVAVTAEVLGDAPVTVAVEPAQLRLSAEEAKRHTIVLTLARGDAVVLDDVRWTFAEEGGGGAFAVAGHGCGAELDRERGEIVFACTEELRALRVGPGAPLEEQVTLSSAGAASVATGRFELEQQVRWWDGDDGREGDPLGTFTVVLGYEVSEAGA